MLDDTEFRLGDIVETVKGAKFWGEIISFDDHPDSQPGANVMAIAPGFEGVKHVYPLKQLQIRPALFPAPAHAGWRENALRQAWTDFLDANPDGLTSPEDLPNHALMTCDQFVKYAMAALPDPGEHR